ncbi:hypothetical protein Bbelb_047480 [Branchiostoma belcheri]|nr:hypothetical protein Bbelb_047480 [Branchiostoma belcheri]
MTSVLLVHDEYGTSRGGISTINRQVALFLVHLGLKVYCTILTATDKDREDAEREHVILLFPQCDKHDRREPSPLWLYDHQSRYPDLPSDIGFVIGHVLVTSRAAVRIKEERFPLAKLYLFTHVLPENTEHYKGEGRALEYGTQDQICRDMKQAHLVLMPSRSEPFGLVGLEAIAAGVPVLVSDRSGLAEFMLDIAPEFDRSIFKFEGNDIEDSRNLAKKIVAMLQNGSREFDFAKHLKDKLLGSRYWEESQKKLAQACGKDSFKTADRPEAQMEGIPAQIQHYAEAQEGGGDQASSSSEGHSIDTWFDSISTLPWDPYYGDEHKMLESLDGVFDHETKGDPDGRFNVLVVGDAGTGKSTLLSKTALDWSCKKGRLAEMNKVVLLVRLREVQSGESMAMIVWDQCVTQSEDISVASIETCLRENEPKLVFLLDGYDELLSDASEAKQTIPKLLAKKLYPRSTVIVTTRPFAGVERYMKVNCAVKVVGFSSSNIEKYATAYFNTVGEPSLAVSLLKALQANVVARSLIQTPMFLMLICVLWEEDPARVFPGTMTGLYQELLTCVIRKYCVRDGLGMLNDEVPSVVSTALLYLGKLALASLLRGESLVDLGKSAASQDTDILLKLGIVSKEVSASRLHPREQLNFPHKTMQEFLAGRYVADSINHPSCDLNKLVPLDTLHHVLQQKSLVQFICGCGHKATREMMAKFNILHEAVSQDKVKSEFLLQQVCLMSLYEGQDPSHFPIVSTLLSSLHLTILVPSREGAALKYYLHHTPTVPEVRSLKLTVQEAIASKLDLLAPLVTGQKRFNQASKGDAAEYLSGLVEQSLPDLWYLSLNDSNIGNMLGKLIPFLRNVPNVRSLNLRKTGLTPESLQALGEILPKLVMLEKLDLSGNRDIGDNEIILQIEESKLCLTDLKLQGCGIGDLFLKSFTAVLDHFHCLVNLDFSHNKIGNKGLEPFSVLEQPVPSLKKLDLSHNEIGDVCLRSLAAVLHHLPCLKKLDLSDNNIKDTELASLVSNMHHVPSLQIVGLDHNPITAVGIKYFAQTIPMMPALKILNLVPQQTAHLDDTAASSIASMLTRLPVLVELSLWNISMRAAGLQAVRRAVKEHTTMQALLLKTPSRYFPGPVDYSDEVSSDSIEEERPDYDYEVQSDSNEVSSDSSEEERLDYDYEVQQVSQVV